MLRKPLHSGVSISFINLIISTQDCARPRASRDEFLPSFMFHWRIPCLYLIYCIRLIALLLCRTKYWWVFTQDSVSFQFLGTSYLRGEWTSNALLESYLSLNICFLKCFKCLSCFNNLYIFDFPLKKSTINGR